MTKYFILLIALIFSLQTLKAQDTIVKIDESIIVAKVLEISQKQIKYKKHSYLEGPTYVIPTHMVNKIIYPNGFVESYKEIEVMENLRYTTPSPSYLDHERPQKTNQLLSSRKGIHISLLFAPTTGNILIKPDSDNISGQNYTGKISQSNKFSNALGFELRVYNNRNFGVKTGLIFQNYNYKEEVKLYDLYSSYTETHSYDYHVRNFGFPLQLSYATSGTVAFTIDFGIYVGLPFNATALYDASDSKGNTYDEEIDFESELNNVIIHETAQAGLLFELSPITSFSLGFYQSYSLMSYVETEKLRSRMYGAYFSLSFKFD